MARRVAMTPEEKEARLLALHGPVVADVTSYSEPDKEYRVRYKQGVYWCPCVGHAIRKQCRHAAQTRFEGVTPQKAQAALAASVNAGPDPIVAIIDAMLKEGGLVVAQSTRGRMTNKLRTLLDAYRPPEPEPELVAVGARRMGGFAVRKIVLED